MKQITEDYVSFEVAKLLQENGFDERCYKKYNSNGDLFDSTEFTYGPKAPTIQMVMKWLREKKCIAVIPVLSSVLDKEKFLWRVEIVVAKHNDVYSQGWVYENQEGACEAAIKYCLENLI